MKEDLNEIEGLVNQGTEQVVVRKKATEKLQKAHTNINPVRKLWKSKPKEATIKREVTELIKKVESIDESPKPQLKVVAPPEEDFNIADSLQSSAKKVSDDPNQNFEQLKAMVMRPRSRKKSSDSQRSSEKPPLTPKT